MSEPEPVTGILEIHDKGYGFLRFPGGAATPTNNDIFVPPDMIRKNGLRDGVELTGMSASNGRGPQMTELHAINGGSLGEYLETLPFEDLTAHSPSRWIKLEMEGDKANMSTRILDLLTPIGHGQRALIVAPPRSGKTMLMQAIADAVLTNHPDTVLMVVLIDERPEEVTDFRQFLEGRGEIWSSSNDQDPASHTRLARLVADRAKRLVEAGKDVFMVLDSITRVARAFNNASTGGGRIQSGGIMERALEVPRQIFAAARDTEEAGSLTIIGTALIDTGSKADEAIYQEFKGTGNCEIVLDRRMSDARVYPAINIEKSGTRREELLLPEEYLEKVTIVRRGLAGQTPMISMERLLMILHRWKTNEEAVRELPSMA